MLMEILKHISEKIGTLSKNQQKVAQHILRNWDRIPFMSATAIAVDLAVSQSTVIRTAIALGFSGFPDMQQALCDHLHHRLSTIERIERSVPLRGERNAAQILKETFQLHDNNLRQTLYRLDPQLTEKAAEAIMRADRVFVLAMRSTAAIGHYLGFNLGMIRKNVALITSDYTLLEQLRTVTGKDILIAVCFSRYTRQVLEAARLAKSLDCPVIGITDEHTSPLLGLSDIPFLVHTASSHYNTSVLSGIALADALLSIISAANKQLIITELQNMETAFERFKTFEL